MSILFIIIEIKLSNMNFQKTKFNVINLNNTFNVKGNIGSKPQNF